MRKFFLLILSAVILVQSSCVFAASDKTLPNDDDNKKTVDTKDDKRINITDPTTPKDNFDIPDINIKIEPKEYTCSFTEVKDAVDKLNVADHSAETGEREEIYDTDNFIRRYGVSGDAYIVYEIPYVSEFYAISCHRPTDVAEFTFEVSKDMVNWTEAEVKTQTTTDEEKWTKVEYTAANLENIRYIKIVWGQERESVHWWNPYFVGIYANKGTAYAKEVVIDNGDEFYIPIYDSVRITLSGKILDQIGIEVKGEEIVWSITDTADENIKISDDNDNEIEISSQMQEGTAFTVKAETTDKSLSAEKKIILKAAMPGDINGDNIITEEDIEFIKENYGREVNTDNRLCDIDKNGAIDIIDLAYAARYYESKAE